MIDHSIIYMARLSNTPLDVETYRQILDMLDLVLGKMKKDEVRLFLFSLLGKNERIMVAKRFTAILLLSQGVEISKIAHRLKLTRQTVVRLKMINQIKNEGFSLAVKKANQNKIAKDVKNIFEGLIETIESGQRANPLKNYF